MTQEQSHDKNGFARTVRDLRTLSCSISHNGDRELVQHAADLIEVLAKSVPTADADRCTYPECVRGGAHLPKGQCEDCGKSAPSADAHGKVIDAARDALKKYIWQARNPKAPIAAAASLDGAMVRLRDAFVADGEPDYNAASDQAPTVPDRVQSPCCHCGISMLKASAACKYPGNHPSDARSHGPDR